MVVKAGTIVGTFAFVAEALAAGENGAPNPFAGDVGVALWTLVIFFLVVVILGKFAWGPILGALKSREEFISGSLAQAQSDREAAEARLKEYSAKLEDAGKEVAAIMEEARRDAKVLRQREEQNAREEADRTIERAKREIELATDTAIKELYARSAKLATDIASRMIGKELDSAHHERLIAESIEELDAVGRS